MTDFNEIHGDGSKSPDEKADAIIALMMTSAAAAAIIPAQVNWAIFSTVLGGGAVAIGTAYGCTLDDKSAWKLIKQFFYAAGFTFLAVAIGSKILAALLTMTGFGHIVAVAMDATISTAIAYAVGECAKAYFKGEHNQERLGEIFRDAFQQKRGGEA